MSDLKSTFTKAKAATSNAVRSFSVAALTTAAPASVIGTVYAVGSGVAQSIGLSGGVSTGAGIISTFFGLGAAALTGIVTYGLSHILIGPRRSYDYNPKAVFAGVAVGLVAAGALTYHLASGDPAKQPTPPVQPTQPAAAVVVPR